MICHLNNVYIFTYSCYFDNTTTHSVFLTHDYARLFLEITATWWYCCLVAPFIMDYFQEPMPPGVHICHYYKNDLQHAKRTRRELQPLGCYVYADSTRKLNLIYTTTYM